MISRKLSKGKGGVEMNASTEDWTSEIEKELRDGILSYWMKHTLDEENGGFYGEIANDNTVRHDADKSLVLNTRILWTFSTAYRIYKDDAYRSAADRAYSYLNAHFIDDEFGGMYWMVDAKGCPAQHKKQIYGQAFAIYALSEYNRATGHERALQQAMDLFELLERHALDAVNGGYREALTREWGPAADHSLSHHGVQAAKTMNTHLHMMEAYTNLVRVWPSDKLKAKLKNLVELTADRIVNRETSHFSLFFDESWNKLSDHISFGHDIEGSWLLVEAANVLDDKALIGTINELAVRMAHATLHNGLDCDGGLWNEADSSGLTDRNKDWWPQAEAMVGFYNAYQLSGDPDVLAGARKSWRFIADYMVDRTNGEWYWSLSEDRVPNPDGSKVNAWKCPYHNARACFEMIERLNLPAN
jgi:mannobiose 2-epimerase